MPRGPVHRVLLEHQHPRLLSTVKLWIISSATLCLNAGLPAPRVMQSGFWAQQTTGPYRGAQFERMSDPWLGVSTDVNSTGELYFSELALDASLQLLEMGKARARSA